MDERRLVDSRLGIDEVEGGVDARSVTRGLGVESLVEDRAEDGGQRCAKPRCTRRADGELEAVAVEHERRRHAALEVVAGLRLAVDDVRLAEQVVQLHVEAREPHAGTDTERVREDARAPVPVDRDHVGGVLASDGLRLERGDEREHPLGLGQLTEAGETRQELRDSREAGARDDSAARVRDDHRIAPHRAVAREIVRGEHDSVDMKERLCDRAAVHARGALVGNRFERLHQTGLLEDVTLAERATVPSEQLGATLERVERDEHLERARVHLRKRDARARQLERGLAEPRPREPAEPLPELAECSGKSRNGARCGTDRVDDGLVSERDLDVREVAGAGRQRREPVEVHDARAVERDRMAACEETAHHRLRDAGRKRHRDHGIGRAASVRQDLRARGSSGRMAGGNSRSHARKLVAGNPAR